MSKSLQGCRVWPWPHWTDSFPCVWSAVLRPGCRRDTGNWAWFPTSDEIDRPGNQGPNLVPDLLVRWPRRDAPRPEPSRHDSIGRSSLPMWKLEGSSKLIKSIKIILVINSSTHPKSYRARCLIPRLDEMIPSRDHGRRVHEGHGAAAGCLSPCLAAIGPAPDAIVTAPLPSTASIVRVLGQLTQVVDRFLKGVLGSLRLHDGSDERQHPPN